MSIDTIKEALRTEPDYSTCLERVGSTPNAMRLLHAALGMATEAAEFADAVKKHVFYGKPLDYANLIEELGDLSWYERIAFYALETTREQVDATNIAKLRKRYPDKFTEHSALVRDLDAERAILEAHKP